ncbi:uncharacterized protein LOC134548626 [Prinia subflava]|uniref:uncharacterized protein LOC134548626 n=1 Tax=Prinia subflava TaxID=208062 RepID=UPI002FE1F38C
MFITLNQPCRKTKSAPEHLECWDSKEEEEAVEEEVSTGAQACSDRDQINSGHLTRHVEVWHEYQSGKLLAPNRAICKASHGEKDTLQSCAGSILQAGKAGDAQHPSTQEDCRLRQALRDNQESRAIPRHSYLSWQHSCSPGLDSPSFDDTNANTFLAISCLLRTCHSLVQEGQQSAAPPFGRCLCSWKPVVGHQWDVPPAASHAAGSCKLSCCSTLD